MSTTQQHYRRDGSGLSFERVALFTDAVYAIAMTLIVVGIGVPTISAANEASALGDALWDQRADIVSFFVGVLVIGFFWSANHRWFDELEAVDDGYVALSLVYLGLVAFLPYPIRLVGSYDQNPAAWAVFAVNLAAVSGMETALLVRAQRAGLLSTPHTPADARWRVWMSLLPVPVFLASIAVAFVEPWLTLLVWALAQPVQLVVTRHIGPGANGE